MTATTVDPNPAIRLSDEAIAYWLLGPITDAANAIRGDHSARPWGATVTGAWEELMAAKREIHCILPNDPEARTMLAGVMARCRCALSLMDSAFDRMHPYWQVRAAGPFAALQDAVREAQS